MRDIHEMPPDEVLKTYFSERRRRENPPSLAGVLEEKQQAKISRHGGVHLSSRSSGKWASKGAAIGGTWESLIGLTRGCEQRALDIMYEASGMWRTMATGWLCPVEGCGQWVDHHHAEVLGIDKQPLLSNGQPITEPVCNSVPATDLAASYGLTKEEVKRMVHGVLERVAENLGARRGRERQLDRDNPTVADLKAMARMVWR